MSLNNVHQGVRSGVAWLRPSHIGCVFKKEMYERSFPLFQGGSW